MAGEKISGAQQENLLTLLAHDTKNGKLIANMVNPDLFEGEYRIFAERFIAYWKKHKKAPKVHAADLFADVLDDETNRRRKTYERILRNIDRLIEDVNTEYVITTLRNFTRLQTMKDAILKAAEELADAEDTTVASVEEQLSNLLRAREFNFDPGMTLLNVDQIVDFIETHHSEFRTGIHQLDVRGIGPARGATFMLLAPPGAGKSWGLIHMGKHALLQRKRVVHITLEMSAEETGQRYYQSLFSIAKRREEYEVQRLRIDKDAHFKNLKGIGNRIVIEPDFAFADPKVRTRLRKEIAPWAKRIPNLIIKRFPPRALTIDGLRAYLDGLEATMGFIPDMIILDYIGIMHTDAKNHRITQGRVMEEFRAICVERNCAGVTAAQVNRMGAEARMVKATHAAEDWSLIATTDMAVTYSQTAAENRLGLARLYVAKARSEQDKFGIIITQAYAVGQFCLQSAPIEKLYWDFVDENTTNDDIDADESGEAGSED